MSGAGRSKRGLTSGSGFSSKLKLRRPRGVPASVHARIKERYESLGIRAARAARAYDVGARSINREYLKVLRGILTPKLLARVGKLQSSTRKRRRALFVKTFGRGRVPGSPSRRKQRRSR